MTSRENRKFLSIRKNFKTKLIVGILLVSIVPSLLYYGFSINYLGGME